MFLRTFPCYQLFLVKANRMSGFYSKTETREKSAMKDHFRGKKLLDSFSESEPSLDVSLNIYRGIFYFLLKRRLSCSWKKNFNKKDILEMTGKI